MRFPETLRHGILAAVLGRVFRLLELDLVEPLQNLRFAYGPVLIAVGVLMLGSVKKIRFDDLTGLVPTFVTIMMILFT
jgi:adenine/guanine/hypoxanthine permease